jgi:hypothetical protein
MNSEQIKLLTEENTALKDKLSQLEKNKDLKESINTQDSLRKLLLLINEYSMELASIPSDKVFEFAVTRVKDFINAKSVHYTLYDEKTKELVVLHTSLVGKERQLLKSIIGKDLVGMRFKVTDEKYKSIVHNKLHVAHTVNELSLGKIPHSIGKLIERTFQVGWFLGIAMTIKKNLLVHLLSLEKDLFQCQTKNSYLRLLELRQMQ